MLLFELRDPALSTSVIRRHFDEISNAGLIRKYLPPMYRRNLGAHEHALALIETRDDPAWLEDWRGVDILAAEYDRASRQGTMKLSATDRCRLQLGGVRPRQVALARQSIPQVKSADAVGWSHVGSRLRMLLPHGGSLGISY